MNSLKSIINHRWNVSLKEAKLIQQKLAEQIVIKDSFNEIETILGVGIVFSRRQDQVFIGGVSFSFPELQVRNRISQRYKIIFPYTTGFFAFSVGPAILSTLKRMERPDLIMFPGRGIAHPRSLGLASHLGVLLDIPTIACSKTPLWKDYPQLGSDKGAFVLIKEDDRKFVGAVVRTREDKKPVFVNPGYKVSVRTAIKIVLQCSPKYRIPEPLRQAQIWAREVLGKSTV